MDQLTKQSIWTALSAIDISDQLTVPEILDGTSLTILPWMNAHALMMANFLSTLGNSPKILRAGKYIIASMTAPLKSDAA